MLRFRISEQQVIRIFDHCHACYVSYQSHIIIQIILNKQHNIYSPSRCHFSVLVSLPPPLGSEFHPLHPKSTLFSNSLCSADRGG